VRALSKKANYVSVLAAIISLSSFAPWNINRGLPPFTGTTAIRPSNGISTPSSLCIASAIKLTNSAWAPEIGGSRPPDAYTRTLRIRRCSNDSVEIRAKLLVIGNRKPNSAQYKHQRNKLYRQTCELLTQRSVNGIVNGR